MKKKMTKQQLIEEINKYQGLYAQAVRIQCKVCGSKKECKKNNWCVMMRPDIPCSNFRSFYHNKIAKIRAYCGEVITGSEDGIDKKICQNVLNILND